MNAAHLCCPECGTQHIDAIGAKPHRVHRCVCCGRTFIPDLHVKTTGADICAADAHFVWDGREHVNTWWHRTKRPHMLSTDVRWVPSAMRTMLYNGLHQPSKSARACKRRIKQIGSKLRRRRMALDAARNNE